MPSQPMSRAWRSEMLACWEVTGKAGSPSPAWDAGSLVRCSQRLIFAFCGDGETPDSAAAVSAAAAPETVRPAAQVGVPPDLTCLRALSQQLSQKQSAIRS